MKTIVLRIAIAGFLLPIVLLANAQQSAKNDESMVGRRYGLYIAALKQETIEQARQIKPGWQQSPMLAEPGQNKPKINPGIMLGPGLPLGKLKNASTFVLSVKGEVRYAISDQLSALFSAGYTRYFGKTHTFTEYNGNADPQSFSVKTKDLQGIPLQAGGNFFLTDNVFVEASVGISFLSDGGGTAFIYSPVVGYRFSQFEAGLMYEGLSKNGTLSFAGLQLRYFFY